MPWGNWTRVVPRNDAERRIMYRLMNAEMDEMERRLRELGERQAAWRAASGTPLASEGPNAAFGEIATKEDDTMAPQLVQDKEDQKVYAVEMDGNQNVIRSFGPIPFHEVGLVLPSRYAMTEDDAARLNGRPLKMVGPHDATAMNHAYADRRGMPVVDGTVQDGTQPEAMPEIVPTPNPPESGKPEGSVAIHDQADDHQPAPDPDQTGDEAALSAAAQGVMGTRRQARSESENENENEIDDDNDPDAQEAQMAREDEDRAREQTEVGTAGDARDSEQYAPREGANMKPGADLRRASQLPGEQPNPQDDQDGRKTQDAENGGLAARAKATKAGVGQQEKRTPAKDEIKNEKKDDPKAATEKRRKS